MDPRPVLYLDVDDTLINWAFHQASPAAGGREFLLWALEHCEVRWLTRRCPDGQMPEELTAELAEMFELDPALLRPVPGLDWSTCESKVNGIAWLEHLVLGRPFLWVEDENGVGEAELRFLAEHGCDGIYHHCNVSMDPEALVRVHRVLRERGTAGPAGSTPPEPPVPLA